MSVQGPLRMHLLRTPLRTVVTALVAIGVLGAPAMAEAAPTVATTSVHTGATTVHTAATPAQTATTSAGTATTSTTADATVTISPSARGVLQPGQDLTLSVTVTNGTDADLPASTGDLSIIRSLTSTRDDLDDWVNDTSSDGYVGTRMGEVAIPDIPAHHAVTVDDVTVPAASVALTGYSFGARRIALRYESGAASVVERTAITWYPSLTDSPVGVSVAMPITVPSSSATGLISASDLAAYTAVDGTLTQQLAAALGHNVAIGVDPRIIASIRILGVNAPDSAVAWLERLSTATNETFALSYADSDLTGLRQAGAAGVLAPISLDQDVDTSDFPGATPSPTGTATADPSGSATPGSATGGATAGATDSATAPADAASATPSDPASADGAASAAGTPAAGTGQDQPGQGQNGTPGGTATPAPTLPTTRSLLDFPYTLPAVAWPVEGSVATDDLPALTAGGYRQTIISSANTTAEATATVGAAEKIGDDDVLVADSTISGLLRTAVTANGQNAWQAAMSRLTAELATTAHVGSTSPVLLTLGRAWPTDSTRLADTLDALETMPWVSPTDLTTVVASTPGGVTLASKPESDERLAQLRSMVSSEQDVADFSTALTTPADLTAPYRLRVLAAASNSLRDDPAFDTSVASVTKRAADVVASVGIVDSSNLNLFADRSSLPISVRNKSTYPVTVYLTVTPSNSFLRVEKNRVAVTVQPDSQTRITFPVQSVANGKVQLDLALTSATGVRIADPSTVEINVQAQWETIITALAAAAVVLIFGLGILRNIRRRLRRKNGEEPDVDDDDPNRPLDDDAAEQDAHDTEADRDQPGGTAAPHGSASGLGTAGSATALAAGAPVTTLGAASAPMGAGPGLPSDASASASVPTSAAAAASASALGSAGGSTAATAADTDMPMSAAGPQPAIDAAPAAERGLGRASAMLAAGTLVSRILGFVKTFVLAAAIGQSGSAAANAFAVSNQLPNSVYTLIAGGLLSAALIPQIVRATKHPDGGQRYIDKIVTIGATVFLVVTVVATIAAPFLVTLYSQSAGAGGKGFSSETTALAVAFAFWCLPQILFYALYSLLGEVLNARQVFGPFTWAPLLNNVIAITGLVVFIALFGGRDANADPGDWTPTKIMVLAGTATVGVAAQAAFLLFFWRRAGLTYRPDFRWRGVGLKSTGTAAGWLFAMILVTQAAGIVQSRVSSLGTGAGNATLQNSWLLFMLPHSIITVSIATAYFTRMSHDAERGDLGAVRRNLSLSLRIVGLFTVFASIALMVVAFPFARLYEHTFGDVRAMAEVLLAYLPGLVLFSMLFIIQRAFWAMHDHRTPFLMQCVQSVLFVIGAVSIAALPGSLIGIGVAAVTTLAGTAQTIVALVIVRRRLGGIDGALVTRSHVQFVFAAVIAGVAGLLVVDFFGAFERDGFAMTDVTSAGITLVLGAAAMAIVYFGALVVAKNAEIGSAVQLLRSRLGR